MSPVHYYVYYKFDPARIDEVRTVVDALFREIHAATGISGQWQRRRDDPSTFMEIFADVADATAFADVVRDAFGQRRKTLRNALSKLCEAEDFAGVGVRPDARAEQLAVEEFIALGNRLAEKRAALQ